MKSEFFETIKIEDGKICGLEYHQARYEKTLLSFGVTKFAQLGEHINPPEEGLVRCKLIYSLEQPDLLKVDYYPYAPKEIRSIKVVEAPTLEYSFKYLNRECFDKLYEQRGECDEVLVSQNGLIRDTCIANIALYDGSAWYTPKDPLLEGTTRRILLENKKIKLANIKIEEIKNFDKIAIMNAMVGFKILEECEISL